MDIVLNRCALPRLLLSSLTAPSPSETKRKTANIVTIRNGERTFGLDALATAVKYPNTGFKYLTPLLGKSVGWRTD